MIQESPSFIWNLLKMIGNVFKISASATAIHPTKIPAQKPYTYKSQCPTGRLISVNTDIIVPKIPPSTIMAFNNDVGVTDVFAKFYQQITGTESNGITELEICYSIGLAVGIIVFFNHVGHKKITHDPTPIQIEMRKYETDLDTAFINNAERRGHSVDVD